MTCRPLLTNRWGLGWVPVDPDGLWLSTALHTSVGTMVLRVRESGAAGLAPTHPAVCVSPAQVSPAARPVRVWLPLQAEGGQGEGGEAHWDLR